MVFIEGVAIVPYKEIDLTKLKTYSAAERASKVTTFAEGRPPRAGMAVADFLDGLPDVLKARDLKAVAAAVVRAAASKKPVLVMLGGHVIKTGCSPILAD
ncbi:MAG: hypothetical protein P8X55_21715, partial [Desulfosarcinaceae bacterium]